MSWYTYNVDVKHLNIITYYATNIFDNNFFNVKVYN